MMHVDARVPKECSDPVFEMIWEKFQYGDYAKLRGTPVYRLVDDWDGSTFYVAAEPGEGDELVVYGWINISPAGPGWECWTVEQVFVFPQARGDGWGAVLYDAVINREGLMLASGWQQSRMGRRMWRSLVKSDRYNIWAHDFRTPTRYAGVAYDPDSDRVVSDLMLYSRRRHHEDIRLVAMKKTKTRKRK